MDQPTLVNLDLGWIMVQVFHIRLSEQILRHTFHNHHMVLIHRSSLINLCNHFNHCSQCNHTSHSHHLQHHKNLLHFWMGFSNSTLRKLIFLRKSFEINLVFTFPSFCVIHITNNNSGGTTAQSTPGATAFASSYLGPTKYNYLFSWAPIFWLFPYWCTCSPTHLFPPTKFHSCLSLRTQVHD